MFLLPALRSSDSGSESEARRESIESHDRLSCCRHVCYCIFFLFAKELWASLRITASSLGSALRVL